MCIRDRLGAYYRMVELARRIQVAGAEESARLCREYIDSVRTLPPGDVYEEASRLFLKNMVPDRRFPNRGSGGKTEKLDMADYKNINIRNKRATFDYEIIEEWVGRHGEMNAS